MAEMVGARPRTRSSRGTLIGGLIALVSFLLLLPLIANVASKPAAKPAPVPRTAVLVAARNIPVRALLREGDVTIKQMYAEDVPAAAFATFAQVKGLIAAANISVGQPLTPSLVAKQGDDVQIPDMAYLPLPTGYVATTIPTNEQQGVAGYIRPGDYIAVIAVVPVVSGGGPTVGGGGGSAGGNARTVLTNLRVMRVGTPGQKTGPSASSQSNQSSSTAAVSSSLTVALTECQAELLNWFLANAGVRYALQSSSDYPKGLDPDQTCPTVASAQGITRADVARRYPGIFSNS